MDITIGEVLSRSGAVVVLAVSAASVVVSLRWLTGLVISLRGSKPSERPAILRAYGAAQPGSDKPAAEEE